MEQKILCEVNNCSYWRKVTNAPLMPFMLSAILVKRLKTAGKQTAKRLSRMIYN